MREHHSPLLRYAVRLTRCPDKAQDLSQEAWVKAWRYLDTFKGGKELAWLKRVMITVFYDLIKREKPRKPFQSGAAEFEDYMAGEWIALDDLTTEQLDHLKEYAADPERWKEALINSLDEEIFEALATLSVDHREVILLYHIFDLQYDEIAKMIDAKEGTVMSRLFRARENLQTAILRRGGPLATRLVSFCASGARRGKRTKGSQAQEGSQALEGSQPLEGNK
jgi:RNA polymerase sigma-70 factor (ECF subfamily)